MEGKDLCWAILPDGLEEDFEIESFKKDKTKFVIVLVEKNRVPKELPDKYRGKQIINNVLSSITIKDFGIRGRFTSLVLKRRYWKFEGIDEMYSKPLTICAPGTKLSQEMADFLKGDYRVRGN